MSNRIVPQRPPDAGARAASRAGSIPVRRASFRIEVSEAVPLAGRYEIAADLVLPASAVAGEERVVLVCLPGAFLSRRYFDLDPGGSAEYSFAQAMAQRGFVTLAFDPFGVGESDQADPIEGGFEIGVEAIAAIHQLALERALQRLARGELAADLPPIGSAGTIGVGHSMGSMLTVEQQALARPHRGLVLFSFSTRGLPRFLDAEQRAYAGDPVRTRRELGLLAARAYGSPYPGRTNDSGPDRRAAFSVGTAPPLAEQLLHDASTNMPALPGLLSMIPGGYAPAAERVDVPVAIWVGDHDLHDEHDLRAQLPRSPAVAVRKLEDCWHCHFVANSRAAIAREVPAWIETVLGGKR